MENKPKSYKIEGRCCFSFSELTIAASWENLLSENESRFLFSMVPFRKNQRQRRSANIYLDFCSSAQPLKKVRSGFYLENSYGLSIHNGKGKTVVSDDKSAFSIDHHTGKGRITFHSSFPEKTPLAKSNFFLVGLIHLFAQYGHYDLHGAGLTNNGSGYLLLGPSGSGKSSLALNLVKQGWRYASDDTLLLNSNQNDLLALSFRKNFYIDPGLLKHFPELESALKNNSPMEREKYFIDLDDIWPGCFQPQFVPKKLVFCSVTSKENSNIQEISKKHAFLLLLPQSASVFFNRLNAQKQVDTLKRLIRQTDCYTFDAGIDVYGNSKKAADILSCI